MVRSKKRRGRLPIIISTCAIVLVMAVGALTVVKMLLSDDGNKRRKQIQMVRLVKPPPPPKIKEKPPEPEIEKKEEIVEPEPEEAPPEQMDDAADSDVPEGDDLGLDADGTAGGDAFGLRGKKGARALIGGGNRSLLRRYAWYIDIIKEDLQDIVKNELEQNGGIPKGDHNAVVRITLNGTGQVLHYSIENPSGNHAMDSAVQKALKLAQISEPPPADMPKTIRIRVVSKG